MPAYTYSGLSLYAQIVPEELFAPIQDGAQTIEPGPGMLQVYIVIDGVPVLLLEKKAGKLLQKIEEAKAASKTAADAQAAADAAQAGAAHPPAPDPASPSQ